MLTHGSSCDAIDAIETIIQESQSLSPLAIYLDGNGMACPCCNCYADDVQLMRRNSQYNNVELNWLVGCGECRKADSDYLNDMWQDYWWSCGYP